MDFWASVDHRLRYKKEIDDEGEIQRKLKRCATVISQLDQEMQDIRNMIEKSNGGNQKPRYI